MSRAVRILSYNIHKGFSPLGFRFVLSSIRDAVRKTGAEIVCLQEVVGEHARHREPSWPTSAQFEFLADELWPHFAYGKNAFYPDGHHGNAILSAFPIEFEENRDISGSRLEQRGILHARVRVPLADDGDPIAPLHLFCTHFGLIESWRMKQAQALIDWVREIPSDEALVVCGDFNDWRKNLSPLFKKSVQLREVFRTLHRREAASFPAIYPVFSLDRIYFRGCEPRLAAVMCDDKWVSLSDHAPLVAEFRLG